MKKKKIVAIIYYLTAAIAYVCSVIWFCSGKGGFGASWLCIGSANLCLGTVWMNRSRESDKQSKEENGEHRFHTEE